MFSTYAWHVSKALDVRAIMGMQDVQTDSGVNTCKTYRHVATVQRQHCGPLI
jgi:hypothetical protein